MTKQDFLRKISSRKFWALISSLAVAILVLVNVEQNTITQVIALIGAFASVAVYIFGEAYVDGQAVSVTQVVPTVEEKSEDKTE